MQGLNEAFLIGNIGADPELGTLPSGSPVVNFRVATNRYYKKDGESVKKTEWHNVVAYDRLAEQVSNLGAKGRLVFVRGEMETVSWTDKNSGETRYKPQIKAGVVNFLDAPIREESQETTAVV
jgi:single-strand DNA-binding protein